MSAPKSPGTPAYKIVPGVTVYGDLVLLKAVGMEPPCLPTEPTRQYPLSGPRQSYPLQGKP